MTHEGIPRPRTEAAGIRSAEHGAFLESRKEKIDTLARRYEDIQREIMDLRNNLSRGMQHVAENSSPEIDATGLKLRAEILQQIEELRAEEKKIEEELRGLGVDLAPSTAQ